MEYERRENTDQNRLWEAMGKHDGRLTALEAAQYQQQQAITNHRAETNGYLTRMEGKIDSWMKQINGDISMIKRLIYLGIGGGIAFLFVLLYIDKIRAFLGG